MSTRLEVRLHAARLLSWIGAKCAAALPVALCLYGGLTAEEARAQTYGVTSQVVHYKYTADQAIFAMQDIGLQSFRDAYYWGYVEQAKGVFRATAPLLELEKAIVSGRSAGQKSPLIILCCTNALYGGGFPISTEARAAFVRYAKWVATRLKGKVYDYQLWNEWNIGAHAKTGVRYGDPVEYTRLLREVYAALKSVDPGIRVVGGGIAGWDSTWAEDILQEGAGQYMDVISIHPYAYPHIPEKHVDYLVKFRDLVNKYRSGLPIYVGEIGWPSYEGTQGVSEWKQGVYLARFLLLVPQISAIRGVWWYNLFNDGTSSTTREHNFGLRRADRTAKHASCTMKQTLAILKGSKYGSATRYWKEGYGWFRRVTYTASDGSYIHGIWAEEQSASTKLAIGVSNGGAKEVMCESWGKENVGGTSLVFVGIQPVVIRTTSASITLK
jgi:polysaccharide biosynthesis protein PslG